LHRIVVYGDVEREAGRGVRGQPSNVGECGVPRRLEAAASWVRRIETQVASQVAWLDVEFVAWRRGRRWARFRVVEGEVTAAAAFSAGDELIRQGRIEEGRTAVAEAPIHDSPCRAGACLFGGPSVVVAAGDIQRWTWLRFVGAHALGSGHT